MDLGGVFGPEKKRCVVELEEGVEEVEGGLLGADLEGVSGPLDLVIGIRGPHPQGGLMASRQGNQTYLLGV